MNMTCFYNEIRILGFETTGDTFLENRMQKF